MASLQGCRHARPQDAPRLEPLPPRVLLSAYLFEPVQDFFDLPDLIQEVAAPDDVATAGFGLAAAAVGDVDGDGRPDFAIAAPGAEAAGGAPAVAGRVFVYSGATGQVLHSLSDGTVGFGAALVGVGDVNDDGRADIAIGSPRWDATDDGSADSHGRVLFVSGADGATLHTLAGTAGADEFGFALAAAGDVNGDGAADLAIGAPGAGPNGEGQVTLISGADASTIRRWTGESAGDRFGAAIAGHASFLPGDHAAVAVGAPAHDGAGEGAGRAYLFSAVDGAQAFAVGGEQPGGEFGSALLLFRRGDLAVLYAGEPGYDTAFSSGISEDIGAVRQFDAAGAELDDSRLTGLRGGSRLGERIALLADPDLHLTHPRITVNGRAQDSLIWLLEPGADTNPYRDVPFLLSGSAHGLAIGDVDGDGVGDSLLLRPDLGLAQVRSSLSLTEVGPGTIRAASRDRHTVATTGSFDATPVYLVLDGAVVWPANLASLHHEDAILAAGEDGTLLVRNGGELFVVDPRADTRTALADLVVTNSAPDAPPINELRIVGIAANGSMVFNDGSLPIVQPTHTFLLESGTLTKLWDGEATDVNAAGQIVGGRQTVDGGLEMVLRQPDGQVVGIEPFVRGLRISDNGIVGGVLENGAIALWNDGVVTELQSNTVMTGGSVPYWTVMGVAPDGTLVARGTHGSHRNETTTDYIFRPDGTAATLASVLFGTERHPIGDFGLSPSVVLLPGWMVADGSIVGRNGFFRQLGDGEPWTVSADSAIGGSIATAGMVIGAESRVGGLIAFRNIGGEWTPLNLSFLGLGDVKWVDSYTDARDGRDYVVAVIDNNLIWGSVSEDGRTVVSTNMSTIGPAPIGRTTMFATADGRVIIAGVTADGDLAIFFQNNAFDPNSRFNWTFDNLTETHIEAQGGTFVPVAGDLTAFTAPWGATHLAYLDDAGNVHAVWWAPGEIFWQTDNLSDSGDAPALQGRLTSFATSWGTLHIVGTNPAGEVAVVWWAPGFEGWRYETLGGAESPKLRPGSLTSYTTPWNGLTIAGIGAETGVATAYWWAPATDEWRIEAIGLDVAPADLRLTGGLIGETTGAGQQNLFAVADEGEVVRLFWDIGDGAVWRFESLLEAVVG